MKPDPVFSDVGLALGLLKRGFLIHFDSLAGEAVQPPGLYLAPLRKHSSALVSLLAKECPCAALGGESPLCSGASRAASWGAESHETLFQGPLQPQDSQTTHVGEAFWLLSPLFAGYLATRTKSRTGTTYCFKQRAPSSKLH